MPGPHNDGAIMHKILIVDDEESVRYSFAKLLRPPHYQVLGAKEGAEGMQMIRQSPPDLVILDIQMPNQSGLEVLQQVKKFSPRLPVLVISAHGNSERVIAAMKHGAYEYFEKPFDIPHMKALIDEALEAGRLMRTEVVLASRSSAEATADRMIGKASAMREVFKMIGRIAPNDVNVLLLGESGTGKELVARAIYQNSSRADLPLLAVNCAAIPETLLESELLGYEKGAFTGATKRKIGKFEQADGGTIFLDEVGDMSFSTQAKLLRVLQEGTFERLGGEETLSASVRLIAATNRDLEQCIAAKQFREDLYYRLKVITIALPPLRQRKEDLPELIHYFMAKYSVQFGKEGMSIAPAAQQLLLDHDWPGNVRELENVLKRALLLCKGKVILPDLLAPDLRATAASNGAAPGSRLSYFIGDNLEEYHGRLYETVMSEMERDLIVAALQRTAGNQVRAAHLLGISRVMLHDRIEKFGIRTEVLVQETPSTSS